MGVVVLDGPPASRQGLREILNETPEMQVVGECGCWDEATSLVEETHPELVILSLDTAGEAESLEACRRLPTSSSRPSSTTGRISSPSSSPVRIAACTSTPVARNCSAPCGVPPPARESCVSAIASGESLTSTPPLGPTD